MTLYYVKCAKFLFTFDFVFHLTLNMYLSYEISYYIRLPSQKYLQMIKLENSCWYKFVLSTCARHFPKFSQEYFDVKILFKMSVIWPRLSTKKYTPLTTFKKIFSTVSAKSCEFYYYNQG